MMIGPGCHARALICTQPILAGLCTRLQQRRRRNSGEGTVTKAIVYPVERWDGLTALVDNCRIEFDPGIAGRTPNSRVITRKSALFAGRPKGACNGGGMGSFMGTCRIAGLASIAWPANTLEKRAAGHGTVNLNALRPWTFFSAGA